MKKNRFSFFSAPNKQRRERELTVFNSFEVLFVAYTNSIMTSYRDFMRNFMSKSSSSSSSLPGTQNSSSSSRLSAASSAVALLSDDTEDDEDSNDDDENDDDQDDDDDSDDDDDEDEKVHQIVDQTSRQNIGKRLSDIELKRKILREPFLENDWECPPSCQLSKRCADQYGFLKYAKQLRQDFWGASFGSAPTSRQRHDKFKELLQKAYQGGGQFTFTGEVKVLDLIRNFFNVIITSLTAAG